MLYLHVQNFLGLSTSYFMRYSYMFVYLLILHRYKIMCCYFTGCEIKNVFAWLATTQSPFSRYIYTIY